ncbi:MAG: AMP-dependent synthetase/ligase [Anaerovoracaceae bacterium]|jgi:long-chain acyl-CoA synthetase
MSTEIIFDKPRDKYWYNNIREVSTIRELLFGSVEKFPERPAFWVKRQKGDDYVPVTYTLLAKDVRSLATALIDKGYQGKRIAVIGMNSYEWIVTYLAVVISGSVIVPLDRELKKNEVENLVRNSGASMIFYTENQGSKMTDLDSSVKKIAMRFYADRTDINVSMTQYIHSPFYSKFKRPDGCDYTWKEVVAYGERLVDGGDTRFDEAEKDPETMSVILYTSGTTGNPKGVMLSQKNIVSDIMDTCRIAGVNENDKTLSVLPIHHTYECTFGMLLVLYIGASTAFCEGLHYITKNMKECGNTVFIAVPLVLEMIHSRIFKQAKKEGREKALNRALAMSRSLRTIGIDVRRRLFAPVLKNLGGNLRTFIIGAAPISPNVIRDFEDMGITVLQGYGLTECTPLAVGTPEKAKERYKKAGSVGVPLKHGDLKIVDPDEDGIGRIFYKGPNVMLGYYNMPEETEEVMHDGWFETGDLGFMDRDGWVYIAGRYKNMIVTNTGKNIYPEEIEEIFNKLPCISECMVYPDGSGGEEVVACQVYPDEGYIKMQLGDDPDSMDVYKLIKGMINEENMNLASYKRIKKVIVRDRDFIRTTTGKIKRSDNIDDYFPDGMEKPEL